MRRLLPLCAAALLVPAAAAHAGVRPGSPPPICASDAFTDQVGTSAGERLTSTGPPQRLYALGGDDELVGSATRASCLFGGSGDDLLYLDAGGGVAWGEEGADVIFGSLFGDVFAGGTGNDTILANDGDDKITSRDRLGELVLCGDGDDIVAGDRADVLVACESATLTGTGLPELVPVPRRTGRRGAVRVTVTVPQTTRAGKYTLLLLTPAGGRRCAGGPLQVGSLPRPNARVRRGQSVRVTLPAPELGWCSGTIRVAVLREPGPERSAVPFARFAFSVR